MRVPAGFYVLTIAVGVTFALAPMSRAKEKKQPIFVDAGFRFEDVDPVYILPAVDIRVRKDQNAEQSLQMVDFSARYYLKKLGYRTAPEPEQKQPRGLKGYRTGKERATHAPVRMVVTEDDLKEPQESWIRKLGPDDAHWVLVLALEDSESHLTFGSTGSAIVMGSLLDRQSGKLVWRGIGAGKAGQGGLIGLAMKSAMSDAAIQSAVNNLCSTVGKKR